MRVLSPSRDMHHPRLVAEVAADLAEDGRCREARELAAALGIEPVDRLDEPDRADLDQIVERLSAVGIPPRKSFDQRHQVHDEGFAVGATRSWIERRHAVG